MLMLQIVAVIAFLLGYATAMTVMIFAGRDLNGNP